MSFSVFPPELIRAIFEEVFRGEWFNVLDWNMTMSLRLVCSKDNALYYNRTELITDKEEFDRQVKYCGLGTFPIPCEYSDVWRRMSIAHMEIILQIKIRQPHNEGSDLIAKLQEFAKSLDLFKTVDPNINDRQTNSLNSLCTAALAHLGNWGIFVPSSYHEPTMLSPAAATGNISQMRELLKNGADLSKIDSIFGNPLNAAAAAGQETAIQLLIENGANIEYVAGSADGTALCLAAKFGRDAVVQTLLQKGAKLEYGLNEKPVIFFALANGGHEAVIMTLLKHGVQINAQRNQERTALGYAASIGVRVVILKLLLEQGADIEAKSGIGLTPLAQAARAKRENMIKFLLENGADIQSTDNAGKTILHRLVEDGAPISLIRLFINNGINIDAKNEHGETALHLAVSTQRFDVINLLLDSKADIKIASVVGETALLRAVDKGNSNLTLVKLLIDRGADISARDIRGMQALHISSARAHDGVSCFLLSRGASVKAETNNGDTALHAAALNGSEKVVLSLLERGASINAQTNKGITPLYRAAEKNKLRIVNLLLDRGADPTIATTEDHPIDRIGKGSIALHLAVANYQIVLSLLRHGSPIEARDALGHTAFIHAARRNAQDTVQRLASAGADVNTTDNAGNTALHASTFDSSMTALLLSLGVSAAVRNACGETPLHLAAAGYNKTLRMLLEHGTEVNARDASGKTALHVAASWSNGHEASMLLLVEKGADREIKDDEGRTAVDYFRGSNRVEADIQAIVARLDAICGVRGD